MANKKSIRIQITLKGGAQIEVDLDELKYKRDGMTWVNAEGGKRSLVWCDADEVSAIVKVNA